MTRGPALPLVENLMGALGAPWMDIRWDSVRWWFDQVGQMVGIHAG